MEKSQSNLKIEDDQSDINISSIIEQYLYYWKWFLLSIIIMLSVGFYYLRYADRVYSVSTKVLIQDDNKSSAEMAGLSELISSNSGGGAGSS